jgi:hypothetical protein
MSRSLSPKIITHLNLNHVQIPVAMETTARSTRGQINKPSFNGLPASLISTTCDIPRSPHYRNIPRPRNELRCNEHLPSSRPNFPILNVLRSLRAQCAPISTLLLSWSTLLLAAPRVYRHCRNRRACGLGLE